MHCQKSLHQSPWYCKTTSTQTLQLLKSDSDPHFSFLVLPPQQKPDITMLSDGEPAFFGMFIIFALLVLLGVAQNSGLLPALHY